MRYNLRDNKINFYIIAKINYERIWNFSECLRRKDEIIKQALREKQLLMADILNIPKEDFEHVADIASEPSTVEKEPTELILAAITQSIY